MSSNKRRFSAGSTPINANKETGLNSSFEKSSPVVGTKRKISFSCSDSESDEEIIFTKQANKRKKMSDTDEI